MDSKDLKRTSFLDEIKPILILQPIDDSHFVSTDYSSAAAGEQERFFSSKSTCVNTERRYKQTQKKCEVFSSVLEHLWDYLIDNYLGRLLLYFSTQRMCSTK